MPQFAANLSMMYTEHPFLDRFEAAAKDGFKAVEFLFPYAHSATEMAARLALLTQRDAPAPLTEAQIDELRRVFGARW